MIKIINGYTWVYMGKAYVVRRIKMKTIMSWGPIEILKHPKGIVIRAIPGALDPDEREELLKMPTLDALVELLEDTIANSSWNWIEPREIGALTEAPIIGEDVYQDLQGNLIDVKNVYWFPNYMIESEVEAILSPEGALFEKA